MSKCPAHNPIKTSGSSVPHDLESVLSIKKPPLIVRQSSQAACTRRCHPESPMPHTMKLADNGRDGVRHYARIRWKHHNNKEGFTACVEVDVFTRALRQVLIRNPPGVPAPLSCVIGHCDLPLRLVFSKLSIARSCLLPFDGARLNLRSPPRFSYLR